ncbi:MAG: hypothetical protein AAF899_02025 [Pseudomonadota bacterium]
MTKSTRIVLLARLFPVILATAAVEPVALRAEPVAVVGQGPAFGQAFTFGKGPGCYALVPDHVVPPRGALPLRAGSPARLGEGRVSTLRFPAPDDFALTTVTGSLAQGCAPRWEDLPRNLDRVFAVGITGVLAATRASGIADRIPVVVRLVGYEQVVVEPRAATDGPRLMKGKSGALLTIGDTPAGLLLSIRDEGGGPPQATIRRMDAMVARIARFMDGVGTLGARPSAGNAGETGPDAVAFEVIGWNAPPLMPEASPRRLETPGAGPYLAAPFAERRESLRLRLDLGTGDDDASAPVALAGVSITAGGETGTAPRRVVIYEAVSAEDTAPSRIRAGELTADGTGVIRVSPRNVRWLEIEFVDSWDDSKPVSIEAIGILSNRR